MAAATTAFVWRTAIRLPNSTFTLHSAPEPGPKPNQYVATFITPLSMGKIDIRNYLENVYGMKVEKVNTLIQLGQWKRSPAVRAWQRNIKHKRSDFKKAFVTFYDDNPDLPGEIVNYRKLVEDHQASYQETLDKRNRRG